MCLEIENFDWNSIRSSSSSERIPAALRTLFNSKNESELERAYWQIDNEAVVQGVLFEASYPVTVCLLSMMNRVNSVSVPYVLELLLQFMCGVPSELEIDSGNGNLQHKIRSKVLGFTDIFFDLLNEGSDNVKLLCVDILGLCAIEDASFLQEVNERLVELRGRFTDDSSNALIENWLIKLQGVKTKDREDRDTHGETGTPTNKTSPTAGRAVP